MLPPKVSKAGLQGPSWARLQRGVAAAPSPILSFSRASGSRGSPLCWLWLWPGAHLWPQRPHVGALVLTCCSSASVRWSLVSLTPWALPRGLGRTGQVHLLSVETLSQFPRRPWRHDTCGLKGSWPPAEASRLGPDTPIALATQRWRSPVPRGHHSSRCLQRLPAASWSEDNHFNFRSVVVPTLAVPFRACPPISCLLRLHLQEGRRAFSGCSAE